MIVGPFNNNSLASNQTGLVEICCHTFAVIVFMAANADEAPNLSVPNFSSHRLKFIIFHIFHPKLKKKTLTLILFFKLK
jgi:hypothetical protein